MPNGWTTITVSPEVLAWITREREYLLELHCRGLVEVEVTDRYGKQRGNGISADQVLRRLIGRIDNHRKRSAKAEKNRKERRKQKATAGASLPPPPPPIVSGADSTTLTVFRDPVLLS